MSMVTCQLAWIPMWLYPDISNKNLRNLCQLTAKGKIQYRRLMEFRHEGNASYFHNAGMGGSRSAFGQKRTLKPEMMSRAKARPRLLRRVPLSPVFKYKRQSFGIGWSYYAHMAFPFKKPPIQPQTCIVSAYQNVIHLFRIPSHSSAFFRAN